MSAAGSPEAAQATEHPPGCEGCQIVGLLAERDRLTAALAAAADREARVRALHQPEGPCSCGGRRWVEDEGWSPEDYERNQPRSEGAGLVPCGFCNPGGWNVDQYAPDPPRCDHDEELWPCPTIAALDPAGQDPT